MQQQKPQPSLLQALDAGLVVQLQALTAQLTAAATANSLNPLEQRVSSFNKVRPAQQSVCDLSQPGKPPDVIVLRRSHRSFWVRSTLGTTTNAATNLKKTRRRLKCEFDSSLLSQTWNQSGFNIFSQVLCV